MNPQKTTVTVLMLLVCIYSSGQTLIPKAGVSFSTITGERAAEIEKQAGFTLGLAVNFALSHRLSMQPELNFIQKGFVYRYRVENGPATRRDKANVHINYIEMPVLIKFAFGDKNRFFINGGPSLGIGMGGASHLKISSRGSGVYDDWAYTQKVKFGHRPGKFSVINSPDELYFDNRLDFGLQVGGGMIVVERIMIELRYTYGLSYLDDKDPDNRTTTQNRVLQLTLGMPVNLK
jgi:hypothetical protein